MAMTTMDMYRATAIRLNVKSDDNNVVRPRGITENTSCCETPDPLERPNRKTMKMGKKSNFGEKCCLGGAVLSAVAHEKWCTFAQCQREDM
eukprot:1245217-Amphidinium_carterae.1